MLFSWRTVNRPFRLRRSRAIVQSVHPLGTMSYFCSYEDSVLDAADENGNLSLEDARKLFADHSDRLDAIYEDNHGISWVALDARNASALLNWLGY